MHDADLILRIERFERTVATCFGVVPLVFSAQCLLVALCAPTAASMFADFGSKLPWPTRLLLDVWPGLALVGVAEPVVAFVIARKRRPVFSLIFSTVSGLIVCVLAQFMSFALILPILQLGAVANGG